ncbi:MAG: class I tRNA ligase family protein, partial [Clostridia bacterium]|nr:class I tRNA ligase family protein [Clostridia bacterium]
AISTLLFDKAPFKNCIVLGHVNDKNGIKMSKHIGNVVDPWSVLDKQGSDAVRWYFYTSSAPWLPSSFYEEAVSEAQRKYLGTLWNTYAFFVLYADIDKFDPSKYSLKDCKLSLMDKWALSKLNSLVKFVDENLNEYKTFEASRKIEEFTDEISNWYVRRCRERYWGSDMSEDKIAAYMTLYTVIVTLAKITAPFTPFIAESIYLNLVPNFFKDAPISVHLCSFPECDDSLVDEKLEEGMELVLEIVNLGRSARNTSNVKNRQPLSKLYIAGSGIDLSEGLLDIAKEELNVKAVENMDSSDSLITYKLKPQLKTLGPKYGRKLGDIRKFLETCNTKEVVSAVEKGEYKVELGGEEIVFTKDDLLISTESASGFASCADDKITVALDINITQELLLEGIERELVSKIQTMRKEAGFQVTDRIILSYVAEGNCLAVLTGKNDIASDVLAEEIISGVTDGYIKEWDINGEKVTLSVKKV